MSKHLDADTLAEVALAGAALPEHVQGCARCAADISEFKMLVSGLRMMPRLPDALAAKATAYFLRRQAIDTLIAKLAEDPALCARLAKEPIAVIREAGIEPSPDLVAALRDVERGASGATERLAARLWF